MKFEWNPEKDKTNTKKHNISFLEASTVFADKHQLNLFDEEHSDDEDRWITIGQSLTYKTLVVIHTYRKIRDTESVRIISARKATKQEEKQYHERRS